MEKFKYYVPTEVEFGRGAEAKTAEYIKKYGGSRVFIVYGGKSAEASGLLGRVHEILTAADLPYCDFGGARPNPTLAHAEEGTEKAIAFKADFVLAIGGGSAIDTAKYIADGAAEPSVPISRYFYKKQLPKKMLPLGSILTIPAAGSELSDSAVLTNEANGQKRGLSTDLHRPKFAIMDPELAFTLPPYQVACGASDILMHTMDRYFNPIDNELTDAIAEALLRTVIKFGKKAVEDPHDYEAMSEIMWAGALSHNGLTGCGGVKDFAVHQLGHELSGRFGTAHGASLTTVWDSWASYVCDAKYSRFARFARNVWGIEEADDEKAAALGIAAMKEWFKSIGMPTCFSENKDLGVQEEKVLDELAESCVTIVTDGEGNNAGIRTVGSFKVLDGRKVKEIFCMANH